MLGAEILHDHFMDVAVALVGSANRQQGIDAPATSRVASRTDGFLSGAPKWAPPLLSSVSDVVSSIMPWLTLRGLRCSTSFRVIVPGFT